MTENPTIWSSMTEHLDLALHLRQIQIHFSPEKCTGAWQCYEVCPVGCWTPHYDKRKVEFHDPELCIACGACVLQCPEDAITLE